MRSPRRGARGGARRGRAAGTPCPTACRAGSRGPRCRRACRTRGGRRAPPGRRRSGSSQWRSTPSRLNRSWGCARTCTYRSPWAPPRGPDRAAPAQPQGGAGVDAGGDVDGVGALLDGAALAAAGRARVADHLALAAAARADGVGDHLAEEALAHPLHLAGAGALEAGDRLRAGLGAGGLARARRRPRCAPSTECWAPNTASSKVRSATTSMSCPRGGPAGPRRPPPPKGLPPPKNASKMSLMPPPPPKPNGSPRRGPRGRSGRSAAASRGRTAPRRRR